MRRFRVIWIIIWRRRSTGGRHDCELVLGGEVHPLFHHQCYELNICMILQLPRPSGICECVRCLMEGLLCAKIEPIEYEEPKEDEAGGKDRSDPRGHRVLDVIHP
jgi:hypothetical protein